MTDGDSVQIEKKIAEKNELEQRLLTTTIESIEVEQPEPTKMNSSKSP